MAEASNYLTASGFEVRNSTNDFNMSFVTNSTIMNQTTQNSTVARFYKNSSIARFYPLIVVEMILSIICLILSIIVYKILPEFKNVHGKNLISLSGCLLTTFILLCLDIVLRLHISYSFCFAIAVTIHVTFLATFFWTNVMTYDIWNNMTSMKRNSSESKTSMKYVKYSIYAWTATVLTALPAIILESTDLLSLKYRPQFGVKRCWLSGKTAFYYYFNLPVGFILLGNLIMFALTIRRLMVIKKMTEILQVKQQQKRLYLYLKLFSVMGIIWFTEFLPWVTGIYKLYALAGVLMALHGVLLFAIFILNRRVLRQIKERMFGKTADLKSSTSQPTLSTNGQKSTSQKCSDSKF